MEIRIGGALESASVREIWVRPSKVSCSGARHGLIEVREHVEVVSTRSDISHGDDSLCPEFLLHTKVPLVDRSVRIVVRIELESTAGGIEGRGPNGGEAGGNRYNCIQVSCRRVVRYRIVAGNRRRLGR